MGDGVSLWFTLQKRFLCVSVWYGEVAFFASPPPPSSSLYPSFALGRGGGGGVSGPGTPVASA